MTTKREQLQIIVKIKTQIKYHDDIVKQISRALRTKNHKGLYETRIFIFEYNEFFSRTEAFEIEYKHIKRRKKLESLLSKCRNAMETE